MAWNLKSESTLIFVKSDWNFARDHHKNFFLDEYHILKNNFFKPSFTYHFLLIRMSTECLLLFHFFMSHIFATLIFFSPRGCTLTFYFFLLYFLSFQKMLAGFFLCQTLPTSTTSWGYLDHIPIFYFFQLNKDELDQATFLCSKQYQWDMLHCFANLNLLLR